MHSGVQLEFNLEKWAESTQTPKPAHLMWLRVVERERVEKEVLEGLFEGGCHGGAGVGGGMLCSRCHNNAAPTGVGWSMIEGGALSHRKYLAL